MTCFLEQILNHRVTCFLDGLSRALDDGRPAGLVGRAFIRSNPRNLLPERGTLGHQFLQPVASSSNPVASLQSKGSTTTNTMCG